MVGDTEVIGCFRIARDPGAIRTEHMSDMAINQPSGLDVIFRKPLFALP